MFGLSFMEIVVLLLVEVVVIGPRQLPSMLRTAGRWLTKLRRMAFDMREQSGIDDVLRNEGLEQDIRQLRALMRKGNVLDALAIDIDEEISRGRRRRPSRAEGTESKDDDAPDLSNREYPTAGADAYGVASEDMDPYQVAEEIEQEEKADPSDEPPSLVEGESTRTGDHVSETTSTDDRAKE